MDLPGRLSAWHQRARDPDFRDLERLEAVRLRVGLEVRLAVLGYQRSSFRVASPGVSGDAEIVTYHPDEFCATNLRGLYQRR